ncbi:hypothetical protein [Amycolatopsis suaedae]|uniref:Cyclase n=1 Tax=Amycolatopsis suaedae TaxID=2510978 RepID=A0A4Q7IZ68_9PSEU|nr:hypothetical protein [Amycolatopsis suaedae]RZQ59386.1 hypothetical protein EWH70_34290 [Amycolatopsis suaedae]
MKKLVKIVAAMAVALAAVVGLPQAASAEMRNVEYSCKVVAPSGPFTLDHKYVIDSTAPATVDGGSDFLVGLDHQLIKTEPRFLHVTNLVVKIAVGGARINDITLTGGVGLGELPPRIEWSGGIATLTIPGPVIKGGADFRMPKLTLNLSSDGRGLVTTDLAGTSYEQPGMTGRVTVPTSGGGTAELEKYCYPTSGKRLTTTLVR